MHSITGSRCFAYSKCCGKLQAHLFLYAENILLFTLVDWNHGFAFYFPQTIFHLLHVNNLNLLGHYSRTDICPSYWFHVAKFSWEVKQFFALRGRQRFASVLTWSRHWTQFWDTGTQSTASQLTSLRSL